MGYKIVEAVDPYLLKVTCKNCGLVFKVDYSPKKEKVEFT
jgi:hypothetical protein